MTMRLKFFLPCVLLVIISCFCCWLFWYKARIHKIDCTSSITIDTPLPTPGVTGDLTFYDFSWHIYPYNAGYHVTMYAPWGTLLRNNEVLQCGKLEVRGGDDHSIVLTIDAECALFYYKNDQLELHDGVRTEIVKLN